MNKPRNFAPAAIFALAVLLPASEAFARNNVAWSQLSAEWWQWVLSIPPSVNPLLDTTGDNCMVGQHGTNFFLAGSWSGTVTRDCDIPQGAMLFFPVINEINFDTPGQCGQGPAPLPSSFYRSLSSAFVNGAANLSVTLDSKAVGPMHRTQSQVFDVTLPDDNIFAGACSPDLTGGVYSPAVDDGYYVRLNPLELGAHTLVIHAENPSAGFTLDVTYNLNVVPVVDQ